MLFGIPFAIWFGILTIISLFITATLGVAMHTYKKPVFKYHRIFAFITVALATVHAVLAVLLWFFGVQV